MLTVYQLDRESYFLYAVAADPDPIMPGNYLIPGNCVLAAPPAVTAQEAARWVNGAWVILPDLRGTVYWLVGGTAHVMEVRGEALPEGALLSDPGPLLADVQVNKYREMYFAYTAAIQQSVAFTTAGGVSKTFQADSGSQDVLLKAAQGYTRRGAVPGNFYWVAEDNTQVPFTLADLNGLYDAMLDQGWIAFPRLQLRKAAIFDPAATIASVQAVIW